MISNNKRVAKPLIQWMDDGDPDLVPIMMAGGRSTAASYFRVPVRTEGVSESFTGEIHSPVTPEMVLQCSEETGIHFPCSLGNITLLDVIQFIDEIDFHVEEKTNAQGTIEKIICVRTPVGEMSDLFETPLNGAACWREHLVKGEDDLPAFSYLVEHTSQAFLENHQIRRYVVDRYRAEAEKWPWHVILTACIGVPAFGLTCALYMGPMTAFGLLFDHKAQMERLFEAQWQIDNVMVECAAEAGADFIFHAINGLEIFSPEIYQNYFIPQAHALHEKAHSHDLRGWVHTCGYMNKLIDMGVYEAMSVDVLESLSPAPLGDLLDLKAGRAKIGRKITTRGAVGVDQFYGTDIDAIRNRVRYVLESTRGYRHMIGDTNDSFPPYPRENIMAVVDEVRKSGRYLPAQSD